MDIFNVIDSCDYVSFDIFDTLIKRNIRRPKNVFNLIESHYNKANEEKVNHFVKKRMIAEKIARKKSDCEEITLDDIYNVLNKFYDKNTCEKLKILEIDVEKKICVCNKDVKKIYDYAVNKEKEIIIVSDMYLPIEVIESILNDNGYDNYKKLYLSSQIKKTKYNGSMYKYIINQLNILPDKIVHIGDSEVSDIRRAKENGYNTFNIKINYPRVNINKYLKLSKDEIIQLNMLNSFIKNNMVNDKGIRYEIGYSGLGPLYYGFIDWINTKAARDNMDKIIFLSRDGYILKKGYDRYYNCEKKFNTEYMYVSRRALIVPSLNNELNFNELINILGIRKKDTFYSFLLRVGLNPKNYKEVLKKYKIKIENKFLLENKEILLKFYDEIKSDIMTNAEKEREILLDYIKQMEIENKKIAIVDIGWRGSMQYSLEKILSENEIEVDISGFYLGMNRSSKKFISNGIRGYGYLFEREKNIEIEFLSSAFIGLLESLFMAPHGSVIGYKKGSESSIEAILDKFEYPVKDKETIEEIQKGALDFLRDFSKYNEKVGFEISEKALFNNLVQIGINPSKNVLDLFSEISFSDYDKGYLARPERVLEYIKNPSKFKNQFFSSQWKVGFMKKLFKINISYYKFYRIMKKIYEGGD